MDRLSGMEVFVAVVDRGGFSAASEQLRLSRAAVSKQIAQLEAHLGGRLLNRTTRSVSLTPIGRTYYDRCRQILDDVADAECVVGGLSNEPRGTLRLNAPMSFGINQLTPIITAYASRYPEVSIDLSLNDRFVDVVEEGYDLVIRIGQLADSNLIAKRLASCHFVICASPAYLKQHGTPATPDALRQHVCLTYNNAAVRGEWQMSAAGKAYRVPVNGPLVVDNGNALCTAAIHAMGMALLPTFIAGDALRSGELVPVLTGYTIAATGIYAVYPSNRYLSAKVRTFIDFIATAIRDAPAWDRELLPDQ